MILNQFGRASPPGVGKIENRIRLSVGKSFLQSNKDIGEIAGIEGADCQIGF